MQSMASRCMLFPWVSWPCWRSPFGRTRPHQARLPTSSRRSAREAEAKTMLKILDNGLSISGGDVRYAWFKLQKDADPFYRCIALRELQIIPVSVREDYNLLGKQLGAVRGLHNEGVSFVYTSLGIYAPDHIRI